MRYRCWRIHYDGFYDRYGESGALSLDHYEKLGGLEGAVRDEAQRVLTARVLSSEELDALHAPFVPGMVRINSEGSYARRRALLSNMPALALSPLRRFVDARLLVTDLESSGRDTIEVGHEALLRTWPQLTSWLAEDRDKLALLDGVQRSAEDWDRESRHPDLLLHRDGRLEDAEASLATHRFAIAKGPVELAYLDACRSGQRARDAAVKEEQERRIKDAERIAEEQTKAALAQRRIARRTRIGLTVAIVLLAIAGWQWWLTRKGAIFALIQTSNAQFNSGEYWEALGAGLRAAQIFRSLPFINHLDTTLKFKIEQSLQQAIYSIMEFKRLHYNEEGNISRHLSSDK
jgi:hypothetical protein